MSTEITMPKLSDTMEEGKILHWLKRPGDQVRPGEPLAEVETDKADMVLEAFEAGVLQELRLAEGQSAPVGAVIALLGAPGEAPAPSPTAASHAAPAQAHAAPKAPEPIRPAPAPEPSPRLAVVRKREEEAIARPAAQAAAAEPEEEGGAYPMGAPIPAAPPPPRTRQAQSSSTALTTTHRAMVPARRQPSVESDKLKASPLARRAAEEAGIDLGQVPGTGPEGRITKRDVDNFLREQQMFRQRRLVAPREGMPGTREELSQMRRMIAQRMAESKREVPHFYVTMEVDMDEAVRFKKSLEATELFEEDITFNDIIIKAAVLALVRHPRINASYENDGILIHPSINVGMAVAVEDGLIVPVIKDCQQLTLADISRAAHRLVGKAAQGGFTSEELSGATFTISNMGMLGIEHFSAVIYPPQAAILAVSTIRERAVVREHQVAVGTTMMVTVSCDHRIVDGVVAGRFLKELKRFLENPASLLV